MAADVVAFPEVPAARACGSYLLGHDVHYIQARLSSESGRGDARAVAGVADDGTITFTGGAAVWNHDPERLRTVLDRYSRVVHLGSHGVLRVPNGHGAYCFSVADEPDPCRSDAAAVRPGESIIEELLRRGGVLRNGRSVLAESDNRQRQSGWKAMTQVNSMSLARTSQHVDARRPERCLLRVGLGCSRVEL